QEDIGLPDLNTENHKIQDMAKEYLQQCLKSGADGFRFDTAKHIGLPTESDDNGKVVKSDFWPNVLEGLKTNDGNTPYIYGEVLQGGADNFKEYSKYINLTSSNYGGSVRSAVGLNGNPDVSKIEDYNSEGVSP
ncbi:alpha-amylase family glycosyl hydrolase, partial [Clostridium paraputrificum]|uniref:alpha-amylase family glycosyl hydrolase n=2 Tax=Clostridium TaxID=1485 RepID=UPI000A57E798